MSAVGQEETKGLLAQHVFPSDGRLTLVSAEPHQRFIPMLSVNFRARQLTSGIEPVPLLGGVEQPGQWGL